MGTMTNTSTEDHRGRRAGRPAAALRPRGRGGLLRQQLPGRAGEGGRGPGLHRDRAGLRRGRVAAGRLRRQGVEDERLSVGLAGVVGVVVTFAGRLRGVLADRPAWRPAAAPSATRRHGRARRTATRRRGMAGRPARHAACTCTGTPAIHRLPAQVKLVALVAFVFVVVFTPATQYWAFGVYAALLVGVARARADPGRHDPAAGCWSRCRSCCSRCSCRSSAGGPTGAGAGPVPVAGRPAGRLEHPGQGHPRGRRRRSCWPRPPPRATCSLGLERLHVPPCWSRSPRSCCATPTWSPREMERMRVARSRAASRPPGCAPGRCVAQSAGALFIRSYERGERVHLAMLSRGLHGTHAGPGRRPRERRPGDWAVALLAAGRRARRRCWSPGWGSDEPDDAVPEPGCTASPSPTPTATRPSSGWT